MFLVRSVNLVVSDKVDKAGHTNLERYRWAYGISGGSGGPRSLRSVEVLTPTPPTPLLSSECPSSNSTLRGQTTQRSVSRIETIFSAVVIAIKKSNVIICHYITLCITLDITSSFIKEMLCKISCVSNSIEIAGGCNVGTCSDAATTVFRGSIKQRPQLGNSYLDDG